MNVMKTSLTIIPMCPRERFSLYNSLSRLVLCYKKDWATLLHLIYFCCLLPVTNYLITKVSIIDNFCACREYLIENRLSFPSARRWVRHSYLSKGLQIIKVPNVNHMNVMKTSLTIIPMCPRERFSLYNSLSRLVLCYKKDWATLLHLIYFCCLLPVTNYLITKVSIIDNFCACREYLIENRLSFPSARRWVRHSYLSKGLRLMPYSCGSSSSTCHMD